MFDPRNASKFYLEKVSPSGWKKVFTMELSFFFFSQNFKFFDSTVYLNNA